MMRAVVFALTTAYVVVLLTLAAVSTPKQMPPSPSVQHQTGARPVSWADIWNKLFGNKYPTPRPGSWRGAWTTT